MYNAAQTFKCYFHNDGKTNLISNSILSVSARNKMAKQEKRIKINCILKGAVAEKFIDIKNCKGLENNTEVIRLIINELYPSIVKEAPHARQ